MWGCCSGDRQSSLPALGCDIQGTAWPSVLHTFCRCSLCELRLTGAAAAAFPAVTAGDRLPPHSRTAVAVPVPASLGIPELPTPPGPWVSPRMGRICSRVSTTWATPCLSVLAITGGMKTSQPSYSFQIRGSFVLQKYRYHVKKCLRCHGY